MSNPLKAGTHVLYSGRYGEIKHIDISTSGKVVGYEVRFKDIGDPEYIDATGLELQNPQ
jgi:hypothetical protein